jgi:hypothetical protein
MSGTKLTSKILVFVVFDQGKATLHKELIAGSSSHQTHISHTFFTKRYLFVALV